MTRTFATGPLFERSISRAIRRTRREVVEDAGQAGADRVRRQLRPGRGVESGAFRNSISSRVTGEGRASVDSSQPAKASWLEDGGRGFEGYGIFRAATAEIERDLGRITADHSKRLARELGGG